MNHYSQIRSFRYDKGRWLQHEATHQRVVDSAGRLFAITSQLNIMQGPPGAKFRWEWENNYPDYRVVHFLMVLCYHLQHPSLYSPEGLRAGTHLLADFVEHSVTPQEVRRQNRAGVDSGTRPWKITGTPTSHGSYDAPVQWTLTAADVIAGGANNYSESIRAWAQATYEALKTSGNLS